MRKNCTGCSAALTVEWIVTCSKSLPKSVTVSAATPSRLLKVTVVETCADKATPVTLFLRTKVTAGYSCPCSKILTSEGLRPDCALPGSLPK